MLKKKDEAKQIVGNYIKFAQSQVWDFEMKSELYSAKLSGKDLHFLKFLCPRISQVRKVVVRKDYRTIFWLLVEREYQK